ncbi:hypothetical protein DL766_001864 [Monosporascus sp. MC13-8B]|uniref:N-acetyltransferase domain-containing protein n=1 Tax=Monosporascus cannonballus TaxID=155416 RepID=A0ABY0HFB7_9PEZI|nr:hypothetical protein DL762_001795 [Monosporascus cannonballus]RYO93799.1 hypothetical protein DL763_004284 [Monosporascus cannonballus]RYP36747.1 hypothetical protein DL766_001864 [Monosporascus sp. MC13-8B]
MAVAANSTNITLESVTGGGMPERQATPSAGPTTNTQIADASPADAAAIVALGTKMFTESFGYSIPPDDLAAFLDSTYSGAALNAELRNPRIFTWTAKDAEGVSLLGFVQLVRGKTDECLGESTDLDPNDIAHLHRLYVDSRAHGGGIGSRLIAVAEERARAEGFAKMWLTVWEENERAQRLYERLGFKKVGKTDFVMGQCVQQDWVMIKDL